MSGRWLTFDCFGTLIDWRHGIGTTGELLFPGHGAAFLDAYISNEAEVETDGSLSRLKGGSWYLPFPPDPSLDPPEEGAPAGWALPDPGL